jgi:hypothetical protein
VRGAGTVERGEPADAGLNSHGRFKGLLGRAVTDKAIPDETKPIAANTSADVQQVGGLSYNLRVGTSPGGIDVVGPMADPATGV